MVGHREDTGSWWVTERTRVHDGSHGGHEVMMIPREKKGSWWVTDRTHCSGSQGGHGLGSCWVTGR